MSRVLFLGNKQEYYEDPLPSFIPSQPEISFKGSVQGLRWHESQAAPPGVQLLFSHFPVGAG